MEKFTDRARRILQLANMYAPRYGHTHTDTGDLLLGMAREASGVATNALKNLGVTLSALEEIMPGAAPGIVSKTLWLAPDALQVLDEARKWSEKLGHDHVGTEHLLLGLAEVPDCVGVRTLLKLNVMPFAVRDEVLALLGLQPAMAEAPAHDEPSTFKPGDVVCLRSGGAPMTVVDVGVHTGLVFCDWLSAAGLNSHYCRSDQLVRMKPWVNPNTGEIAWHIKIPLVGEQP
jgi:ATP-dependent Clp protease ATP-binding subunit ClpA